MKIISQGVAPLDVPQQATCLKCDAVIEFTPREVERIFDQRDGDFYQFKCPCCEARITKTVPRYNGPG